LGLDPQQVSQAGELGIRTFRDVYEADLATLQEIEGVGPVTAGKLHEGAEARL
jgi:predicted flap endonuclease-1-like 5' DNA nuclease